MIKNKKAIFVVNLFLLPISIVVVLALIIFGCGRCCNMKGYRNVVVGHARSMRYNAGGWKTVQYGTDLKGRERERND
jgi:hypothetical protein